MVKDEKKRGSRLGWGKREGKEKI